MSTTTNNTNLDYLVLLLTINILCSYIYKHNKDNETLNSIISEVLQKKFNLKHNLDSLIKENIHNSNELYKQNSSINFSNTDESIYLKCFSFVLSNYYLYSYKSLLDKSFQDIYSQFIDIISNTESLDFLYHNKLNIETVPSFNFNEIEAIFCKTIDFSDSKEKSTVNYLYANTQYLFAIKNNKLTNSFILALLNSFNNPIPIINISTKVNIVTLNNDIISTILVSLLRMSKNIENIKADVLGKNGLLTKATKIIVELDAANRSTMGGFLNKLKSFLSNIFSLFQKEIININTTKQLYNEKVDVTLPIHNIQDGGLHVLTKVTEEVVSIFQNLDFKVIEGSEIEHEQYNFTALNFEENHPARNSHDTFYFNNNQPTNNRALLRTHTSTVQIRAMENYNIPIKVIVPGRVYRCDNDATHTPMFHQLEGLYINKKVSIAHLKGLLIEFCEKFFNIKDIPLRFRPSYFPFTSPSLEVDIACNITKDKVIIGKGKEWLEILGCGMVHPNVLNNCNIDSKEYNGFAFGMGLERLAMLKYGFPDIRDFFNSKHLWLKTYKFNIVNNLYNLNRLKIK